VLVNVVNLGNLMPGLGNFLKHEGETGLGRWSFVCVNTV
jgi:hypothetical protein